MKPMRATGDYITRRGRYSYSGLADGPLLVIDVAEAARPRRRTSCCTRCSSTTRAAWRSCRSVTRSWRESMQPKFAPLEKYYLGVGGKWGPTVEARMISTAFKRGHPRELFADVLPHQHAAARQQRQPDDGLRRDHRDRVGGRPRRLRLGKMRRWHDGSSAVARRQALAWPLGVARRSAFAKDARSTSPTCTFTCSSPAASPASSKPLARAMAAGNATLVAWSLVGDLPWMAADAARLQAEGRAEGGRDRRLVPARAGADQGAHRRAEPEDRAGRRTTSTSRSRAIRTSCCRSRAQASSTTISAQLQAAYDLGIRHIQLVHYIRNAIGDFQTERPEHSGLTDFGKKVVRGMQPARHPGRPRALHRARP